jgi:D-sedoheptulose 7-phosphate isomerase
VSSEAWVAQHLDEHLRVAAAVRSELAGGIAALADETLSAVRRGATLFFCGNGGSAADAQHLAAEYVVRFQRERSPIAAVALTTDTSILTAAGNDYGFDAVFERQLRALARPGDLLMMHSTSGASENLLRVARAAGTMDVRTAALLAKGGGPLADLVDLALVIPTASTARAQEMHMLIGHAVCDVVDRAMSDESPTSPST